MSRGLPFASGGTSSAVNVSALHNVVAVPEWPILHAPDCDENSLYVVPIVRGSLTFAVAVSINDGDFIEVPHNCQPMPPTDSQSS